MGPIRPLSILLVEDNPGDARLIEAYLGNGNRGRMELRTCERLSEALDLVRRQPPDAVLLDLGLPDSRGLETIDRLAAHTDGVPVIVLTGRYDEEVALQAIQRGAQDYLPKGGFDEELLIRTIRYAVERSNAEKSIRASQERYRNLFEQANEAIVVVSDEIIRRANSKAVELLSLVSTDLIGKRFVDIAHPDDRDLVMERHRRRMRGEDPPCQYGFRVVTADGTIRWVEVSVGRVDWEGEVASLALMTDVTERIVAERRTRSLLERQTLMNELTLALGTASEPEHVYRILYEQVRGLLDTSGFILSLYDRESDDIRAGFVVTQGEERDVSAFPRIPLEAEGAGTQSRVIRSGRPLYIPDWHEALSRTKTHYKIHDDGQIEKEHPTSRSESGHSVQSALLAPMVYEGAVVGVLQLQSRSPDAYGEEDLNLLSGLANVAAIAIRNVQLVEEARIQAARLRGAFDGIIETVSAAAEIRDPYTAGHQKRVARLAAAIAETLGLDEDTVESVRVASLVHDLGKLGIPAEILTKPSQLSNTEFEIIKTHTETAYRILRSIDFPWPIAEVVYQHHERLDGSGYPRGLRGDEVSLEARIIGVADVVEAMASHRPYRPALGLEAALEEVRANIGTRFDPAVAEACLALFEEHGFDFDEGEERAQRDEEDTVPSGTESRSRVQSTLPTCSNQHT